MARLRVLLIDDSAVVRRLLRSALAADPEIEVVGEAGDGQQGLAGIRELQPDAVVCDVEMPVLSGIDTVREIRRHWQKLPVIMFAAPTRESAAVTLEALHAGADDFVTKPTASSGASMTAVLEQLRVELGGKLKILARGPGDLSAVARAAIRYAPPPRPAPAAPAGEAVAAIPPAPAGEPRTPPKPPTIVSAVPPPAAEVCTPSSLVPALRPSPAPTARPTPAPPSPPRLPPATPPSALRATPLPATPVGALQRTTRCEAVLIGVSTGGPNALAEVIPRLPADLPLPVLVVQHMPPVFTRLLAERLQGQSRLPVVEAAEGDEVLPGRVYIAPGDYHLTVRREQASVRCRLNRDPPENSVRPAADVLFRSAASVWGGNVLVVIMTGMGQDGLLGALQLHELGAPVIAQDEATSVVWGMPGAVHKAGIVERLVPLSQLAETIALRARMR